MFANISRECFEHYVDQENSHRNPVRFAHIALLANISGEDFECYVEFLTEILLDLYII